MLQRWAAIRTSTLISTSYNLSNIWRVISLYIVWRRSGAGLEPKKKPFKLDVVRQEPCSFHCPMLAFHKLFWSRPTLPRFTFYFDDIGKIGPMPAHPTIFFYVATHKLIKCFEHAPVVVENQISIDLIMRPAQCTRNFLPPSKKSSAPPSLYTG
jgi:hypothetical protein